MHTDALPLLKADEYPGGLWYYEPHTYQPYRYVLGRVGRHPLVCIGINPAPLSRCAGPHPEKCGASGQRQRF